ELEQGIRRLADEVFQLGVRDRSGVTRFAFEVVRDTVAITRLDVPVDTVVRGVELAADVPLRERRVGPVEYVGERLRPGDPIGLLCPEAEPVRIGGLVRRSRDIRITRERLRRIEAAILLEQVGYCFLT